MDDKNMSIVEHLEELRRVIVICVIAVFAGSMICFFAWGDFLFEVATDPLKEFEVSLVYISMTEAFLTKVKISIVAGVVLVSPVLFWQIWGYVVPALRPNEKRAVLSLLPISLVLFASGVSFAYYTVFRFAAGFLLMVAGEGLSAMISVSRYVSFLLAFVLPFGFIFQLPLIVLFLTRAGIISAQFLMKKRKYVILAAFVIGAVLTPPDVISQVFMAGTMILLYEISILIARLVRKKPVDYDDDLVQVDRTTK
jgi:sec-independent protein translocase protein TatC